MLDQLLGEDAQARGRASDSASVAREATEVTPDAEVRSGLLPRVFRRIPDLSQWPAIATEIARQAVELFPRWRSGGLALGFAETNWEALRQVLWIREQLPTHLFCDEPPDGWDADPDEWRDVVEQARSIWYRACAVAMQFHIVTDRVPNVKAPPAVRQRQLSLFD
jgi:hypothetical protein